MITSWDIYWITRLDGIHALALSIFIIFAVISCFVWIPLTTGDYKREIKRYYKLSAAALLISSILLVMIPTTKEAAAIYLIPKIVNNEQVQKIPDNAMKLLNTKMEAWIADMTEKKGKKEDKK